MLRLVDEASGMSREILDIVIKWRIGRHAFVGIAFESRDDAFEFNVTIGDHIK